jgi:hypothetical protein
MSVQYTCKQFQGHPLPIHNLCNTEFELLRQGTYYQQESDDSERENM